MKYKITHKDLFNRSLCLNSTDKPINNANFYYNRFKEDPTPENVYNLALECAKSTDAANRYFEDLLPYYVDSVDKNSEWGNKIVYAVESVASALTYYGKDAFPQYATINETITKGNICDRINRNHNTITEYTNIDEFARLNSDNSFMVINKCCEVVNNFDVSSKGKVIIALEEFALQAGKNNIAYKDKDIIDIARSYYAIKENLTNDSLESALKKNVVMEFEGYDVGSNNPIEYFLQAPIKDITLLYKVVSDILEGDKSGLTIVRVFFLLNQILVSTEDEALVTDIYNKLVPDLYEMINEEFGNEDNFKEIIDTIIEKLDDEITIANGFIKRYGNDVVISRFTHLLSALNDLRDQLEDLEVSVYSQYNVECMRYNISESAFTDKLKVDAIVAASKAASKGKTIIKTGANKIKNAASGAVEGTKASIRKAFKPNMGIIPAIGKIDKYLAGKCNTFMSKAKKKVRSLKFEIFGENVNPYDFITIDGNIDYVVETLYFEDEEDFDKMFKEATNICRYMNESLLYDSEYNTYYTATNNIIEFHIKSNEIVELSEQEIIDHYSVMTEQEINIIMPIMEIAEYDMPIPTIEEIEEYFSTADVEHCKAIIELASLIGMDKEDIEEMYEVYKVNNESSYELTKLVSSYEPQQNHYTIALEATEMLSAIVLEDKYTDDLKKKQAQQKAKLSNTSNNISTNTKDNSSSESDNKDESSMQKIDRILNNVTLAVQGLKKKAKDLGAKEQEASRNADVAFNGLVRGIKNALVSDRREAIIKGSVIPSFSRCIKISIALIAIGFITGGPAIPAIIAIGAFAMSKKLTKKERQLLLDDIDVELEIIDKEIANAEARNRIKKMRALMKTKKNLERQKARIKLNIRIGKDLIPGASGIPTRED